MNIIRLIKENKLQFLQICMLKAIFLIFFLNIFFMLPGFLFYALILFVVGNLVLGIINHKKRIVLNIILLGLSFLLFIFLLGYLATILGSLISVIYLIRDYFSFFKN